MQIWNRKIKSKKSLNNRFWEGFGLHLGGDWDALGPLLGALGRSWALLELFLHALGAPSKCEKHFLTLQSALGGFWTRFCIDFRSILKGLGAILAPFLEVSLAFSCFLLLSPAFSYFLLLAVACSCFPLLSLAFS